MKTTRLRQSLPGIRRIWTVSSGKLPPAAAMCAAPVSVISSLTEVDFYGEASLQWEESHVMGAALREAVLEFSTPDHVLTGPHTAFVVEDISGQRYLIGASSPPYPDITVTANIGIPGSDSKVYRVKVVHKSPVTAVRCIVSV